MPEPAWFNGNVGIAQGGFMEIYNITHSADLDGLGSAAMLIGTYGVKKRNILFADYNDARFDYLVKEIKAIAPKGSIFIISDINIDKGHKGLFLGLLSYLKERGNTIIWLDHHSWSPTNVAAMKKYCSLMVVGENADNCAAQLVHKIMCNGSKRYSKLAAMTHFADFNIRSKRYDPVLKRIAFAINNINNRGPGASDPLLREVAGAISKYDFGAKVIKSHYDEYVKDSKKNLEKLSKNIFAFDTGNIVVGVGFGSGIHTNAAAEFIKDRTNAAMTLYVNTAKMQVSMRSTDGIDCIKLASRERGGGHPKAAGFPVETKAFNILDSKGKGMFVAHVERLARKLY
jgi:oligoribonuclease NrnB/cAMP/cGMP phosphodiesterase (DHH superfamily)